MENHTKRQDSVYFASAENDALYVNLYLASELSWPERRLSVEQTTDYPFEGASRLTFRGRGRGRFALRLRVPSWAEEFTVEVNGKRQQLDAAPGAYASLARNWRGGDTVDIAMPLRLHTEAALDDPEIQSVYCGPSLLAIRHEAVGDDLATGLIDVAVGDDLEAAFEPTGEPLHFTADGSTFAPLHLGTVSLRVPAWAVGASVTGPDGRARPVAAGAFAAVTAAFAPGEEIRLELPMRPRWTVPDPRIDAVRGCAAVERGPVVLCAESIDLPGGAEVADLAVDASTAPFERDGRVYVAARVVLDRGDDRAWPYGPAVADEDAKPTEVQLVPFHLRATRTPASMRVRLPLAI